MITIASSSLHSNSRLLEVLVVLQTILPMVIIRLQLQVIVKGKVILRMVMGDTSLLSLSLDMLNPSQMLYLGMISNKVIILHLDMVVYQTHQLMAIHLRMELKLMPAKLHLCSHLLLASKVMLLVSSQVLILITLRKELPSLVMEYLQLPKLVMGLSNHQVMAQATGPRRLKSLLLVNQLMGKLSSHLLPKEVMASLGTHLLNLVMDRHRLVMEPLHLSQDMEPLHLSQAMEPRLMADHQLLNLTTGSRQRTAVLIVVVTPTPSNHQHTLLMAVQVAIPGEHMIQLQRLRLASSQVWSQKPRLRNDACNGDHGWLAGLIIQGLCSICLRFVGEFFLGLCRSL